MAYDFSGYDPSVTAQDAQPLSMADLNSLQMPNSMLTNGTTPSADSSGGFFSGLNDTGAVTDLAGSLIGAAAQNQGSGQANSAYANALSNYNNVINQADPRNFQVQLSQAQLANYNPAVTQNAVQMAPNAAANLGPNANVMAQQQANNQMLQGVAKSGYTPEMMAAFNQMQQSNNSNATAQIKAAQQSAAARGMGASGQALAASANAASQVGLNAANTATGNMAAQGFQNKMAAMGQLGALTNAQQAQLSGLAAQQAQMTNQYNQAGTTLNADIGMQNVARQNAQQNLQTGAQQQNYNMNTGIANNQAMQNQVNANQMSVQDRLAASGGASNQYGNVARNSAGNSAAMGAAMSQGVGALLDAFA